MGAIRGSGVQIHRSVVCCCLGVLSFVPRKPPLLGRWEDGPGLFRLGRYIA